MMSCEEVRDLLSAFALEALEEGEMTAVRDHIESCDQHGEAAELIAAARSLAFAPAEREPPPALKSRIMQEVRAGEPAVHEPDRGGSFGRFLRWRALQPALTGAMAAAIVGLVIWIAAIQGSGDSTVVLSIGDDVLGGRVVLLRDEDQAIIDLHGLADLTDDLTYQVWAIGDGGASSSGLLEPEDGAVLAVLPFDPEGVDKIAVTIEPAGGSDQPTTEPILAADL